MINKILSSIKWKLAESIAEATIIDLKNKHAEDMSRKDVEIKKQTKRIEQITEHRMKHKDRERQETIDKIQIEKHSDIEKLKQEIQTLNRELSAEKKKIGYERGVFYKLKKAYEKNEAIFEGTMKRLRVWIEQDMPEVTRIEGDSRKETEKAHKEISDLSSELNETFIKTLK